MKKQALVTVVVPVEFDSDAYTGSESWAEIVQWFVMDKLHHKSMWEGFSVPNTGGVSSVVTGIELIPDDGDLGHRQHLLVKKIS